MTVLESLFGRGGPRAATVESPLLPLTSSALVDLLIGPKSDAGVPVTEHTAMGLPSVFRAVSLLAGTSAALPLDAYEKTSDGSGRQKVATQPEILTNPHPDLTEFEWRELAFVHLLLRGNAFGYRIKNGLGVDAEIWWIDPARVRVGRDKSGAKVYAVERNTVTDVGALDPVEHPESFIVLRDDRMLHVPGLGYDGTSGYSPITLARTALGTALATQKHGARFFGSGTMLSGILSSDSKLTPDQAETVAARWKAKHSGPDNSHDVAVLGHGTTFQPISISPADAQFIETQKFGVTEVARLFGIPPHMLMDTEKSTSWGTGIEQQGIGFVTYTLGTWLTRFEHRLNRLVPDGQYVRHNVAALLRGDAETRFRSYSIGRQWGWFSVDDVRALEDLPPLPNGAGQAYLTPANMQVVGSDPTAALPEAPSAPIEGAPDA